MKHNWKIRQFWVVDPLNNNNNNLFRNIHNISFDYKDKYTFLKPNLVALMLVWDNIQ